MQEVPHGIISFFLILMAVATALGAVFPNSLTLGLLYICVVLVSFANIVYSYCAKCPCRTKECGHVIPGRLTRLLPRRKEGPYSFFDILSTIISGAAIVLVPQIWLIDNILSLVVFWLLMVVAGLEIVFLVCPDCSNKHCQLNKGYFAPKQPKN
jgi:hypothetical protein